MNMQPTIQCADLAQIIAGSASRSDLWTRVLQVRQPGHVAEIGVWKGDFATEILARCKAISKYYLIDPWAHLPDWNKPFNVDRDTFESIYAEAMRQTEFAADRRVVLRGKTEDVIDSIPDESLDFVYIDGDHTLRGITIDLIRALPKVRYGGMIGGDDFVNHPWQHPVEFEPTFVCPFAVYFAQAMKLPIWALPHNQFLIERSANRGFSFTDLAGKYSDLSLNRLPKGWVRREG